MDIDCAFWVGDFDVCELGFSSQFLRFCQQYYPVGLTGLSSVQGHSLWVADWCISGLVRAVWRPL